MSSMGKGLLRAKKQSAQKCKSRYQTVIEAQRDLLQNAPKSHQEAKLKSIWETSNMDEFLSIADQREQGYMAERNVRVVVGGNVHVVSKDSKIVPHRDDRDWFALSSTLPIPKRPKWAFNMRIEELHASEKADFVEWRRALAKAEEENRVLMTPFEKNLDVWRQLWRVVERSDLVLEIIDARNPMSFRSADLEKYISSFKNGNGVNKNVVLLLNKSDLLTESQRKVWAEFLSKTGLRFFFFSAKPEEKAPKDADDDEDKSESEEDSNDEESDSGSDEPVEEEELRNRKTGRDTSKRLKGAPVQFANPYELEAMRRAAKEAKQAPPKPKAPKAVTAEEIARSARMAEKLAKLRPYDIVSPEDLLDLLAALRTSMGIHDMNTPMVVGMVGYPNVGKSSTINAIIGCKKVVVSATPGKTKHFQTLTIPNERRIMLCDCPGLVFPSFASTRETMICDGILPIDTVRDYVTPIAVVCQRIPTCILEALYRVSLRLEDDLDDCTSLADRLLCAVSRRKGYMTEHDKPNRSRSAKEILKMYVDGALVYVHPPRGHVPEVPELLAAEIKNSTAEKPADAATGAAQDTTDGVPDEIWEDISSADEARALSDDGDHEEPDRHPAEPFTRMALFFDRSSGAIAADEIFNFESNAQIARPLLEAAAVKPKRKKHNPQLEEDPTVMVNEHGLKELVIDSDDDIEELVGASGPKPKAPSKRKMRREMKRAGANVPTNPTKKVVAISDLNF